MDGMEKANIRPRGRPRGFGTEMTLRMVREYNEGASMRELAERYCVNVATISRTLRKHNEAPPASEGATGPGDRQPHDTTGGAA
mgnify:CR=1 FL=1